jgi:2-keto-3-deoxy-L-rhamnonate aldolase RhmA
MDLANKVFPWPDGGSIALGLEIWLRDPRIVELMGALGYDFVHIENEHVANNWRSIEEIIRAARQHRMASVYRCEQCVDGIPPANEIRKAIACGANIIKVPHVGTADTARTIVRLTREPKGASFTPGAIGVWVIVETQEGLDNVDEIMAVDGIDAVGFGHQDYAISAGLGAERGAAIESARDKVKQAALRHGKQMWFNTDEGAVITAQREDGIRLFRLGVDIIMLQSLLSEYVRFARG